MLSQLHSSRASKHLLASLASRSMSTDKATVPPPPKKRLPYRQVLSGIQPTGQIHIGNYYGALTNWVTMQEQEPITYLRSVVENIRDQRNYIKAYGAIPQFTSTGKPIEPYQLTIPSLVTPKVLYSVVDLHAITVPQNPKDLRDSSHRLAATLLALGVSPEKAALFLQSHVAGHSELCWLLACNTPLGRLYRMTQFKDKAQKLMDKNAAAATASSSTSTAVEGEEEKDGDGDLLRGVDAGLLMYPVLMAADILLYNATHVPVGADQTQHLELTRELARIMNHNFGKRTSPLFVEPECIFNTEAARVMSLKNATQKMSKSDASAASRICLTDTDAEIRNKIKGAQTDALGGVTYDPATRAGIANLLDIFAATINVQRQRQHFASLHCRLRETAMLRHGLLQDPALLHVVASQGITDAASAHQHVFVDGAPAHTTATTGMGAPSTLPDFDAAADEFLAVTAEFSRGCNKVTQEELAEQYRRSKLVDFKTAIADALVGELAPIREHTATLLADKAQLDAVLAKGAAHANNKAQATMDRVRVAMGMVAPLK